MTNHNNMYSILGKLSALQPAAEPTPAPKTNGLNERMENAKKDIATRLNERYAAEKSHVSELSNKTLGSYAKKAAVDAKFLGHQAGNAQGDAMAHAKHPGDGAEAGMELDNKAHKRLRGVNKAVDKMTSEDMSRAAKRDGVQPGEKIRVGGKTYPVKEQEVTEAYINNSRDAINLLAELRKMAKSAELGQGRLNPNQIVNDLWDVMQWIEHNMSESIEENTVEECMDCGQSPCACDSHDEHSEEEYDQEGEMSKNDLHTIIRKANELEQHLGDSENMPEWVQAKLTQAKGMIDAATEYMLSTKEQEHETSGEGYHPEMDEDGPNKSDVPAFQRKAKGGADWKVSTKDLDDEQTKSPTSSAGLARRKKELGMNEGTTVKTPTGLVHKGTYGNSYQPSDDEDDAPKSTEPKKKGRPAKHKGPERVTAKSYKYKDGRKAMESIKLDTYVEDTMAEIQTMFLPEKAVSKQQQKFMGMVHAMQTGDKVKGASPELKKVAKTMGKKDAKDFASTKHKGLPKKVSEGMLSEGMTLQAIAHRYGKEVRDFSQGGDMDDNLFHALYDYYFDDMPYGVKKARDGDPYEWVADAFDQAIQHGDIAVAESSMPVRMEAMPAGMPGQDHELDELAKLAGLHSHVNEASCNMTESGQMCPVHGMSECWSGGMMESAKPDYIDADGDGDEEEPMKKALKDKEEVDEAAKPDFLDVDKDGDKKEPFKKAVKDKEEIDEAKPDYIDIDKDGDKKEPMKKAVKDKELEEAFSSMLKLAGMSGKQAEPVAEEYANEPDEVYVDTDAIVKGGADLNRPKVQDPKTANKAANPLGEVDVKLESRLQRMYDSIKVRS